MDKEVVRYCLMMFSALAANHTYGIAVTMDGIGTTVAIMKMWVLNVTDTSSMQRIGNFDWFFGVYVSFNEEWPTQFS